MCAYAGTKTYQKPKKTRKTKRYESDIYLQQSAEMK